jgi:LuxR family maltose regulon positive regulatory protein
VSDFSPIPIIRSKLYQPGWSSTLLLRDRLLVTNPVGSGGRVTLVSAPAGYGKSTIIAQYIEATECSCAWLSLDPEDSDLRRFLAYVVAALRDAVPGCCPSTAECLQMPVLPGSEELAAVFCNDLDDLDDLDDLVLPIVLVLDDYYLICGSAVHDFLNQILRRPPKNLHTVIITRRDPPLALQGLRASALLAEIRMQQLAFTAEESHEFIRNELGDTISTLAISGLHQRTEGWPVALRLAALAAPESGSRDEFAESIPSDIHSVREYLLVEVLAKHPPELSQFLLRTAFLDRFCARLCEAVLPDAAHESMTLSGNDFMSRIHESGLFSIALDNNQEWYRYHHLFQILLQERARSDLGEDEIRDIRVRASKWFEDQGHLEEAISHLLQASMITEAGALIVRHRNTIMNNEQWHRLESWLRMLPPHMLAATPELLLLKARFLRTRGSREESWQTLEQAEALLETTEIDQELRRELLGSMESSRCFQLYAMSDGPGAVEKARQSLELLPDDSLAERGFALIIMAAALQMTGEVESAKKILYAAMSGGGTAEDLSVILSSRVLIALGFVQWMDADLSGLRPTAEQGAAQAALVNLGEALAVLRSFQGAVLYHRNELVDVHDRLRDVTQTRAIANAEFYAQCMIISSLTYQELGDTAKATSDSAALTDFALMTQNAYLIAHAEAFSAEISLRQGRMAEALSWAERFDPEPLSPMYVFYSPQLTQAKVFVLNDAAESGERAEALLNRLIDYLTSTHNKRFLLEALALRAMLLDAKGEGEAAKKELKRAIDIAQPGRFIRVFVDLGPRLVNLLHGLKLDEGGLRYVGEIVAAFRTSSAGSTSDVTRVPTVTSCIGVEPLSKREQQILALLASRLSNKEIADRLHISPVTVKRHTANIYQKLGVHGRRQAVAKATGMGMFSDNY